MSWKPEWCEIAKRVAAANGWRLAENKDGALMLSVSENGPHVAIDFSSADEAAQRAINDAAAALAEARDAGKPA